MERKKKYVTKKITDLYKKNNRKYNTTQTDTTFSLSLTDSLSLPITYIFYFNPLKRNLCEKEEIIFNCDSCLQKWIDKSIESNNFWRTWRKVGENTYYIKFPWNTLMEIVKADGIFMIRYSNQKYGRR